LFQFTGAVATRMLAAAAATDGSVIALGSLSILRANRARPAASPRCVAATMFNLSGYGALAGSVGLVP
jgi:hypothetical protein